jgi:UDP-N-acetylmuramyl tripeptide synthase
LTLRHGGRMGRVRTKPPRQMSLRAPGIDVSPELLAKVFARVRTLVLVTGTNGKSTTAHLIEQMLARARRFPVRNRDGANMVPGLVRTLSRALFLRRRPVVLEVDEGTLSDIVPPARPQVFVVTNVFRDQLDRFGEVDRVADEIRRAVASTPDDCVLVANSDDPTVAALALRSGRKTVFFGLDVIGDDAPGPSADSVLCPQCGDLLSFARAFLSHLGHYECRGCGFARPAPNITARAERTDGLEGAHFTVDGAEVSTSLVGIHGLYNAMAALTAARVLGIEDAIAFDVLKAARSMPGRSEWIPYKGRSVFLALVKNPAGFEAATRVLAPVPSPRNVLVLLNDRWADSQDVSWIWDADFGIFRGDRVCVGGTRAEALALRLKYARIESPPRLFLNGGAFEAAIAATEKGAALYVLMNYSAMLDLFRSLRRRLVPA